MNNRQNMTAQEKSSRGLPLAAADIEELMKDPNSWVSKLYADCITEAYISHQAFIRYVESVMQEEQELAAEARAAARLEAAKLASELRSPLQALSPLTVLKVELTALLSLSQNTMSPDQLALHNQKLTANFSNLITANLIAKYGPTISTSMTIGNQTVPITLTIPQSSSQPSPTLANVLKVHESVNETLAQEPEMRQAFAEDYVKRQSGYVAVMNSFNEFRSEEKNQIVFKDLGLDFDDHFTPAKMRSLVKMLEQATLAAYLTNATIMLNQIYGQGLIKPVSLAKFAPMEALPSVTQPPAMFARTQMQQAMLKGPTFGQGKKGVEADDHLQHGNRSIKAG